MSMRKAYWAAVLGVAALLVIGLTLGGSALPVAFGAPGVQGDAAPAPRVFDTNPLPGEELGLQQPVMFFFDVPMRPSAVEPALSIDPAVDVALSWSSGNTTLTVTPLEPLARATEYTFTIGVEAESTDGQPLEEPFTLALTTVGYLEVSEVLPAPESTLVDTDSVITVIFNRPVVPLVTVEEMDTLPDPLSFDPPLEGKGEWLNTSIYLFTPANELRGGTDYTATIGGDLADVTGGVMQSDYTWTFSTIEPDVLEIAPGSGWERVPLEQTISVTFSQAMDPGPTEDAITLVFLSTIAEAGDSSEALADQRELSGTFAWSDDARSVTFTPDDLLQLDAMYEVRVATETARSATGATLREDAFSMFYTVPYPAILGTSPGDGEIGASPYGGFTIHFNTNMDLDTLEDKVLIDPEPWRDFDTYYYDYRDSYTLSFDTEPSTEYTITILPGMADEYGNTIDEGLTVTYVTAPYPPELTIQATGQIGMYSAHNPATRVFVTHRNVSRIDLSLWRMSTARLAAITGPDSYDAWYSFTPRPADLLRLWTVDVSAHQDLRRYELLYIADKGPSGIANIECLAAPDPRVKVGDVVIITREDERPLNIRQDPNLGDNVISQALPDETMQITGGPFCADGYLWWQVRLDNGITGWAAEGSQEVYFFEPLGAAPSDPNLPEAAVVGAPYTPEALDPGVYYLEVTSPETEAYDNRPRQHVLVVQSANITLKFSQRTALAWVTDLNSGAPLEGVPVIFYNSSFNPVGRVMTDADGLAVIDIPELSDLYTTMYATVDAGEWFAFATSQWTDGMDPWQFEVFSDYQPEDLSVYLYTDRPIYRPGQPVYFKGIVRSRQDVTYSLPGFRSVPVQVYDDRGEVIFEQDLLLTPNGSFSGEVLLANDAPLGYYRIVANVSSNQRESFGLSFNVAEYRAPEFQVEVTPQVDQVAQGDTINVLVESRYFFGGAVSDAAVSYSVLSNDYYFNYTGDAPGYWSFTDENYDFYAPEYYGPYGGQVAEGEGKTDAQGRFMIELPADLGEDVRSKTWTIEARVVDESDQLVAGRASVIVHQGLVYVGVQPEEYIGYAGRENLVNVLAVDWDSAPVAGQEIAYEVVERRWFSVQEEDEYGRTVWTWDVSEEPVEGATGVVTADADGLAQISFTPPVGGVYKVYATTTDDAGNQVRSSAFMWVSGSGFINWRQENNNRIQLITDKDDYAVGDTAEILIPSPWQGEASALVTVERGDILTQEVLRLETNSTVYQLPIEESFAPNIFFSVVLVKGVDANNPTAQFRMGMTELSVDTDRLVMDITVESSVDIAAGEFAGPGDEVEFMITATDWEGTPVPNADVGVGLTDLAVLSIAPSNSSELLPFFYSARGVSVRTSSALTISVDQATQIIIDTIKGGGGGYGEGGIFEVRQEFVDTPLWEPAVVTDENGQATVTVTLPDNLTTWRLDARAVTTGEDGPMLVGQTTFDLLSTKPVLLRPGTPRFFIAGDRATVSAIVNNNSDEDLLTEVTLEGTGFTFLDGVTNTQWVQIPSKGRARVNWQFEVLDVPEVDLTFFANAGDGAYTDATKPTVTQGAPLPVYKYEVPETVGTAGTLAGPEAGSRTETVVLPRRFDVTQGQLNVRLDRSLAAATVDGLDWLRNFPYYCIEQVISAFMPNAITLRALNSLGVEDPVLEAHLKVEVGYALQRLYSQQKVDGGWGWFPQDPSNPIVTAYALIGLVEAQRSGFAVDQNVIDRAAGFVTDSLMTVRAQDTTWRINRQAFLLYALAHTGHGDFQRTVRLFDERESMSLYAKAYLAMTFHLLDPDDDRAMELVNDLNNALVVSATGAHWEETYHDYWNWNTDTRTTALGLLALAQIDPDNQIIPNVVRWLMVAREADHWETTQETAWAVLALTEWMVVANELHPDYTFAVRLNGDRLELEDDTATSDNVKDTETLVIEVAELLANDANRLVISRTEGDGNLYYTTHLTAYLPVPEVEALNRGIIIARKYSLLDDPDANPIVSAEVGQPVQVTLTIIAPNDLHYVVVEDPLPAGADAVNPNLLTSSQVGTQPSLSRERPLSRGWGWWWFSNIEFRDEKAVLYATYLPRGTYQFEYVMYPGLAGEYNVIPPTAQEFYFPEVYGRGEGSLFTITGGSPSDAIAPSETDAAELAGPVALTGTFTSESGISVNHPQGWVAAEDPAQGVVQVASSEDALTRDSFIAGDAGLVIFDPALLAQLPNSATPGALLITFAQLLAQQGSSMAFDEAYEMALGENTVPAMDFAEGDTAGTAFAFETADGARVLVFAAAYADELENVKPLLLAIAASITYDAP